MSRHTFLCRDMVWLAWGRGLNLVLRPSLGMAGGPGVAPGPGCGRCRDPFAQGPACAPSVQRACTMHATHLLQCTVLRHCLEHCSWTLFLDHCSFEKKSTKLTPRNWAITMCLEHLEVTGTSLTSSCISLCSSGYRSTHGLYEGLLTKNRWRSTIASWTTSTPLSSTCHLHKSNSKFRIIFVSYY